MKKESEEFALVYTDGDPMQINIVASLLEDAGIECMVKNAGVQNLFALGGFGGINPLIGVMKILVRNEDRKAAENIISEACPASLPAEEFPGRENLRKESGREETSGFLTRLRKWFLG